MTTFTQNDPRLAPPAGAGFTDRRSALAAGGFGLASLFGLGVAIISIIALDGYVPRIWSAIGAIAVGAVLLLDGAGQGAHISRDFNFNAAARRVIGNGALGVEVIAGLAVIVLGILALLNVAPWLLLEISAIAFGAAFVLSSASMLAAPARRADDLALRSHVSTYASARPIAGMAAVILGILALTDVGIGHQPTFVIVSLLAVGCAALLGGLAHGGLVAPRSLHFGSGHRHAVIETQPMGTIPTSEDRTILR